VSFYAAYYKEGGFNCSRGGDGSIGRKHSDETKQKMSEFNVRPFLGKHHTEESKQKMSISIRKALEGVSRSGENNPRYGKHLSNETKEKISNENKGKRVGKPSGMKGKKHSEETKEEMSKNRSGEKNPNFGKKVSQQTKNKVSESHIKNGVSRGENNPHASITDEIARQIKILLLEEFSYKYIAENLKVSIEVIKNIKYGRSWKHVQI
jgi:hypothetical protein